MFQEFYDICKSGVDLNMVISSPVHGKLAVSVLPAMAKEKGKKDVDTELKIKPLVVSGTPEEMEAGFLGELEKAGRSAVGLVSNLRQYKEMVAKENESQEKQAKASTKTGKTVKGKGKSGEKDKPAAPKQPQLF